MSDFAAPSAEPAAFAGPDTSRLIIPTLPNRAPGNPDSGPSEFAQVKRFFEVWMADAEFRSGLSRDAVGAAAARGLKIDPFDIRYLWDEQYRAQLAQSGFTIEEIVRTAPEPTQRFFEWIRFCHQIRDQMRAESQPFDARFAAWRERQIARSRTTFRRTYELFTPHVLFAIELSKGCSVGCWFCGVSAEKLDAHFLHSPSNQRLFLDVLSSLRHYAGLRAGGWGFLYWATDPFDNPDYEKFSLDFQEVLGRFPTTTTAQPLRDPERTHAFLRLVASRGASKIRFSITTLRILDRLYREFSPEELGRVDLIPINKGSILRPSASGRARERYLRKGGEELAWAQTVADTTISCVSGFLINMVDRTVKLISPCISSEKWPLGYYVYEERNFASGKELHEVVGTMIERHMPVGAPTDKVLRFRGDLLYRGTNEGFILDGLHGQETVGENPLLRDLGDALAGGRHTGAELARELAEGYGLERSIPLGWIDQLFAKGLIDEEPRDDWPTR
jgi:radical SAM family RiPP maturation amino acid epimerase